MERIAIIKHSTHQLFIDDVDEEELENVYDGEEEAYIRDNYNLKNEDFSWDYITDAEYFPIGGSVPTEIDFDNL